MEPKLDVPVDVAEILQDYTLAVQSRHISLIGRREVLTGKGKFGIFGDGKETAQIALAKAFKPGDWRSGYYRDQTLMMALGQLTMEQFFAQLYAHADVEADPHSAGRQMNAHFASRMLNPDGSWKDQTRTINSSPDLSPTGSQMPRLVGLGYASRIYREVEELAHLTAFSRKGAEVAFGTIGNASCAEGMFWEAVNAIGVLGAPVVIAIYDDGYGISVPNKHQITREDLSLTLSGFQREPGEKSGYDIYTVKGWDYPGLLDAFSRAATTARREHVPAIVHVIEMTQPQGHSTSGSHERYKSAERLKWEEEFDPISQMRAWIIREGIAPAEDLDAIEKGAKKDAENARKRAWEALTEEMNDERDSLVTLLISLEAESQNGKAVQKFREELAANRGPLRKDIGAAARRALFVTRGESGLNRGLLENWHRDYDSTNRGRYGEFLYDEGPTSALRVKEVEPEYAPDAPEVPGYQLLNANFDALLERDPRLIAFGEDLGYLGGVNQGFSGLQEKYGELRVSDTGIREATIMGQAIGMALRGLRPIAEMQYLDYVLYALQIMSDDLATIYWRTAGGQKAPVIIRTRGHRLEGIWHSGSPMAGIINLVRGIHVLVPRNMTQAAGFYNTLARAEEPGMVVEPLNGYRLREKMPSNVGEYTIPLGVPEIIRPGDDVTVVTYGPLANMALEAAHLLAEAGIESEVIDVRSLLPFDLNNLIGDSLRKTSRILFVDEDVPGGTTAYMMGQVIEKQGGFWDLDLEPRTLSAAAHRPPYGSDGSYFSKPGVEDIVEAVYDMMNESDPETYPAIM
jgi:pyruvate/2-oxoglutarate/acetoin dehydrogenase E1 component/TPP-dependent pyruvate/acetoin dehydrogenase alpha subunit